MEHKIISYSTSHIFFKITLIVLCFSNLGAATYYVSLSGNDNWPGTSPDSTWRHVAYATQQAQTGDSILVFEDTYEDEHAVFANSGSSENPIVLTAYNNTFTLDGIDNTGMAIRMVDKSYINISGFHIKNYGTGIRGEGLLTNLEISNFIIEDIAGEGVDFDGASLQNSVITDFTIRNTDGIAVTHFDYSSTDCHDVEISHFLIRDVNNEGINWRNTKRVHIHHGEIYNTASDGIHLQLNIDSSTVEYVRVDSTNWHGIAIHDHTVGDYPCSTNVIRYCYVANCGHNDIDLHSGAFNTVIEACTVGGPLTNGQAIYFHNLGAGLIVRNCVIQDVPGDGIDGGPSSGQYLRDILIENNSFYNLSCGIRLQGATENITIRGNRIYNTPYDIQVGAYNILIDSNYTENGYYRINGNDGRIFDALDTTYHARSAYGSFVTVG
ncbi:right-handed parallel beta-helix repeat-containing protein, partial [candidate division WOR-3 bacterium]|nr:right-handed parallel beta-helix repeat-containing protein [candidate division WOR-3 bacterium]